MRLVRVGEFPFSQERTKMKLSSLSTNDLKEFVLATIDRRHKMPIHVETTAVTINQGKGTSN